MSRMDTLQECYQQVSGLFVHLSVPLKKALAAMLVGVMTQQSAVLSEACVGIPGRCQNRSKQRRLQRLVASDRLKVPDAQRCILQWLLGARHGRVDLLLDATTTGATAHQAGSVTLCVAMGWRGRAVPLVWRTFTANAKGQDWKTAIRHMLGMVKAVLPVDTQVVLMADRGLSGGPLARLARAMGWDYVLRVQRRTRVRQEDGRITTIGELVPGPGTQCCLSQVRVWAPRRKGDHWISFWTEAMAVNVVAVWRESDAEPWLLVTSLPARPSRCADYRRRTWQEELFRDLKSFGWNWQRSRVRQPERVERLLLVLSLATLWVLALSQRVIRNGQRYLLEDRARRCYSWFQLGIKWFSYRLANDLPIHCCLRPWPNTSAAEKLS